MYYFQNGVCIGVCFMPEINKYGLFIGERDKINLVSTFENKESAYSFYNLFHIFLGYKPISEEVFEEECFNKDLYKDISEEEFEEETEKTEEIEEQYF